MIETKSEVESPTTDATLSQTHSNDKHSFQYVVALSVTMLVMSCGFSLGWSSSAIPKLFQPDSPVSITLDESSWIISLIEVGFFITAIPSTWMMEKFGRKITLIIGAVPITTAWILMGTANTIVVLFIGRILMGCSFGLCVCVVPVYLGEIASPKIRGRLLLMFTIMAQLGTLVTFIIGPFVSFQLLSFAGLVPVVFFCISIIWLPESPYYLLSKEKSSDALKSLAKLRRHSDVHIELKAMSMSVTNSQDNNGTFRELFYNYGNRRAFIIVLLLTVGQCLCGGLTIVAYAQTIFQKIGNDMDPGQISIVFGCVQLLSGVGAASVIDYFGRRVMVITSVLGTIVTSFVIGLYFFLARDMPEVVNFSGLPITMLMLYIVFYYFGLGTILYCLMGEIFPQNLKKVGGFLYTQLSAVLIFGMHKLFQVVSDNLGSDVMFWSITVFLVVFFPLAYFLVPETKGKKLDDILTELNTKKGKLQDNSRSKPK